MRRLKPGSNDLFYSKTLMHGQVDRADTFRREIALMPVRIDQRDGADIGEARDFFRGQLQRNGGEIIAELRLDAATKHQLADAGAGQQACQGYLRRRNTTRIANAYQHIKDIPPLFDVSDQRLCPTGELAGAFGSGDAAAVLARQQTGGKRTPEQNAKPLIDRNRQRSYSASRASNVRESNG